MNELTYKIEVFEGPLDLLLSLIYKNKVDITNIPIALIFDQYMEYLDQMKEMDMEVAGEFIVMASELMLIKSRMLLPRNEEEPQEDPRARLASALIEYKHAKEIAEELEGLSKIYSGRLPKDTEEIPADDSFIAEHNVRLLQRAMVRMLMEQRHAEPVQAAAIKPIIKRKIVPVGTKILSVMRCLKRGGRQRFEDLFASCTSRSELVATFLAILELLKVNRISVYGDSTENVEIELDESKKEPIDGINTEKAGDENE